MQFLVSLPYITKINKSITLNGISVPLFQLGKFLLKWSFNIVELVKLLIRSQGVGLSLKGFGPTIIVYV